MRNGVLAIVAVAILSAGVFVASAQNGDAQPVAPTMKSDNYHATCPVALPATDNPEVARKYAVAAIVCAYLRQRERPYENDGALVNLVRDLNGTLK